MTQATTTLETLIMEELVTVSILCCAFKILIILHIKGCVDKKLWINLAWQPLWYCLLPKCHQKAVTFKGTMHGIVSIIFYKTFV